MIRNKDVSSHLQYVATLPCEIRESKNVTDFQVERDN